MEVTWAQIFDVEGQLRAARRQLDNLQVFLRSEPEFARQHGRELIKAEQNYSEAASAYQGFRALIGLQPAPGISGPATGGAGLGVAVGAIVLGAAAAAKWALIVAALAALWLLLRPLTRAAQSFAQARETAEANRQIVLVEAADDDRRSQQAATRGDFEEARRLADRARQKREQAGVPGGVPAEGEGIPWATLALGAGLLFGSAYLVRELT